MTTQGQANFSVKSWDENAYAEIDGGRKLTKASVVYGVTGDLEGESRSESLMAYAADGTATFLGLDHIVGRIGDRSGSFVLQTTGTYDGQTARAASTVVPGSGTGDFARVSGTCRYVATKEAVPFTFDLDFG